MPQVTVQQAMELAMQYMRATQWSHAESIYRQILGAQPNNPEVLNLLGAALLQLRRLDEAEQFIRKAIACNPANSDYPRGLGQVLATSGRMAEAVAAFKLALSLNPNSPEACNDLGGALLQNRQASDAAGVLRQALAMRANFPQAWMNLGNALKFTGQLDEAISAYRQAITLMPEFLQAHYNLGNALREAGDLDGAAAAYRKTLSLHPTYTDAQVNLGTVLRDLGRYDEAIAAYRTALNQSPEDALAHANLGMTLLLKGDLKNGWREYEWRDRAGATSPMVRQITQPRWDGSDLKGKRILLHSEQGFGDTIQFIRYAPLVAQKGGKVFVRCPVELERALRGIPQIEHLSAAGAPLPEFDVHCPMLSLPNLLGTTLDSIPRADPYITPDADASARWRKRMPDGVKKIGLAWAGRGTYKNDRNRSLNPEMLSSLLQIPGKWFCSLQKGAVSNTIAGLTDWSSEFLDFADTAALIDNLDLVVTVDTAVAHLAGAMGKPVWVLLPLVPDWRWLLDREDSPWYLTMRLFRQTTAGDWQTPIARIAQEL